jgi:anti-anti-sigma factor
MATKPTEHFRWFLEDDVAIVEVLSRELNQPHLAQEFGAQLRALLASRPSDRLVVNFSKTVYMSSTAFATLFDLYKHASAAGVRVALCGMSPAVRVGADILCLGEYVPIFDDEASALASLAAKGPAS